MDSKKLRALAAADFSIEDVDLLIVATCTPDTEIPAPRHMCNEKSAPTMRQVL